MKRKKLEIKHEAPRLEVLFYVLVDKKCCICH
jgi:hypothetical protein